MTPEERQLLNALAGRVRSVPAQQKDAEAEQFIRQLVNERPDTAYILAQTVIMQDFALNNAQAQIEELQARLSELAPPPQERSGGFLGGLFGGGRPQAPQGGVVPRVNPWGQPNQGYGGNPGYGNGPQGGPGQAPMMQQPQGGGFLRSAATTALGVAGGAALFSGISSMFGSSDAHAAPHADSLTGGQGHDQQADFGGDSYDYGGDDFGGGGDDFG